MDKEKKEKIALFRFGVISRLLWVKEDRAPARSLTPGDYLHGLGDPLFQADRSGTVDRSGLAQEVSGQRKQD